MEFCVGPLSHPPIPEIVLIAHRIIMTTGYYQRSNRLLQMAVVLLTTLLATSTSRKLPTRRTLLQPKNQIQIGGFRSPPSIYYDRLGFTCGRFLAEVRLQSLGLRFSGPASCLSEGVPAGRTYPPADRHTQQPSPQETSVCPT